MTGLDRKFEIHHVVDTPVSKLVCTGTEIGALLGVIKPIDVHSYINFILYALDAVVNRAAKWSQ